MADSNNRWSVSLCSTAGIPMEIFKLHIFFYNDIQQSQKTGKKGTISRVGALDCMDFFQIGKSVRMSSEVDLQAFHV